MNVFQGKLKCILLIVLPIIGMAQQRIDKSIPFQNDPNKLYSIYVPSNYKATVPNKLMIGLHPLNQTAWNAKSWCDTLIAFAEENNIILLCPDGGVDGAIDDPIDTAFTSFLLDSISNWYTIDKQKIYLMGFSWGAKTVYTYGLSHAWHFGGFMPIGAAITGASEMNANIQNAKSKAFYLIHGASDSPSARFYPARTELISNGAIEEDLLMPGIGHTINFPNRNSILSAAFRWIDSVNCHQIKTSNRYVEPFSTIAKVTASLMESHKVKIEFELYKELNIQLELLDIQSRSLYKQEYKLGTGKNKIQLPVQHFSPGVYLVSLKAQGEKTKIARFVVF